MALAGKVGVILGVANGRSLAWGVAAGWAAAGAALSLGIHSARHRGSVERLTAGWAVKPHIFECDVTSDAAVAAAFDAVATAHGGRVHALLHSIAHASAAAMRAPLLETSRADFAAAHDVSAYSLIAVTRAAAPLLAAAGGGSVQALSYIGATRVVPSYRVMGPAKASLEAVARQLAVEMVRLGVGWDGGLLWVFG